MKLLVSSGKPDHDSCGERVAERVDLVVLQRLAVGDVGAGHGERRDGGQQVVRVGGHRTVEGHRAPSAQSGSPNVVRALARVTGAVPAMMVRWTSRRRTPPGLRLAGRRVVVVGGGHVAQRRVPQLIAVGADVVAGLAGGHPGDRGHGQRRRDHLAPARLRGRRPRRRLVRHRRDRRPRRSTSRSARARSGAGSSACAPTTPPGPPPGPRPSGRHAGVTVAVLGNREPRRSAARPRRDPRGAARGHDRRPAPARPAPGRGAGRRRPR